MQRYLETQIIAIYRMVQAKWNNQGRNMLELNSIFTIIIYLAD